jgi:hypothetical protein
VCAKAAVSTDPGANPAVASYNPSVANFYDDAGSLACFENKNIFHIVKTFQPTTYNVVSVDSKVLGLAPDVTTNPDVSASVIAYYHSAT